MVSVVAFYSDDPSSNPAEAYIFSVILCLKRMKINKKEAGWRPFKKTIFYLFGAVTVCRRVPTSHCASQPG